MNAPAIRPAYSDGEGTCIQCGEKMFDPCVDVKRGEFVLALVVTTLAGTEELHTKCLNNFLDSEIGEVAIKEGVFKGIFDAEGHYHLYQLLGFMAEGTASDWVEVFSAEGGEGVVRGDSFSRPEYGHEETKQWARQNLMLCEKGEDDVL